eukprot:CAMPEP_0113457188 /NCGR_PEP_ID=MMETSP0014_2-20120614/9278_1 /TAXON_ID=2857 /ORGANISM="Nitzschia sp." /LENGTH=501 /DNA_ID=CAMNT_0000348673 /DNA_START=242 /DNA_END=1747 /DNA_ORIENTATION=+ /assembly_acc=CAM_ASM_000159
MVATDIDIPVVSEEVSKEKATITSTPPMIKMKTPVVSRRNKIVDNFFKDETGSQEMSKKLLKEIRKKIADKQEFMVETRRTLHKIPELMYNEEETSAFIQKTLKKLRISYTTGWGVNIHQDRIPGKGGYGIVADIGTGNPPCVLLRADMDALPIFEETEGIDEFKSKYDGRMHACGHDSHTTQLLAAASILKSMETSLKGTIRLMFQPAEEGGAGCKRMIEEGILSTEPTPTYGFALHVNPLLPSGTVASRPGPVKAAAERFEIIINGVGGHAAMPHLTVDPIVTASSVVTNLQTLVSRNLSPLDSGVCSITKFDAGHAFNVIPARAHLRGTIRALTMETLLVMKQKVEQVVMTTADIYGCTASIKYSADFYPPTSNDEDLYENFSKGVAATVAPAGEVLEVDPGMGAEDFGFLAEEIPCSYFMIGTGSGEDPPTNFGLHHPKFALDESQMPLGAEMHVNWAIRALKYIGEESCCEDDDDDDDDDDASIDNQTKTQSHQIC